MKICCIKGCETKVLASGMCAKHYKRMRLYGDPSVVKVAQLHGATLEQRWSHYTSKGPICWEWTGSKDANGYGRLNINNRPILAHRLSWELHFHEISSDQHVLHRCDNPGCVRPDHLFLGDQVANNADMVAKGRFSPGVSRGIDHGCAKLTEEQVRYIRASKESDQLMADKFGISRRHIRDIKARMAWAHLS